MLLRTPIVVLSCVLGLAACGEVEDTRPGQPVAQRRAAFKNILRAFEPMGLQLREGPYEPDKFLAKAKELSALKDTPWPYFAGDTNYPPSRAKARVWSEPDRFDSERRGFLTAADGLLAAAERRDEQRVRTAYATLHEQCRSCHKAFKD